MTRRRVLAGIGLIGLCFTLEADADSCQQAMADAYQHHPSLAGLRATWRASQAQVDVARAARRPALQASASVGYLQADEWSYLVPQLPNVLEQSRYHARSVSVDASQPLYHGGALVGAQRASEAQSAIQSARLQATEQQTLLAVGQACADLNQFQAALTLAERYVANLETATQDITRARAHQDATRTDVAQAHSRLAQARADLSNTLAQLASAQAAFSASVGRAPRGVPAPVSFSIPAQTQLQALEIALAHHPDLAHSRHDLTAATAQVTVARGQGRPSLDLNTSYYRAKEADSTTLSEHTFELMASVSHTLFAGGVTQSKIRQAKAEQLASSYLLEETERTVRAQMDRAWPEWQTRHRLVQTRRQQWDAAQRSYDGLMRQFARGERSFLDTLNALKDTVEAENQWLAAENQRVMAGLALLAAMGLLTPDQLQLPLPSAP